MEKTKRAWPMPKVVSCLDDGVGTMIRPLTRDLYMQSSDFRLLPLRQLKSEKRERRFWSCTCFAAFFLTWLGILFLVTAFLMGMYTESTYFHRFRREAEVVPQSYLVQCPSGQSTFQTITVPKYMAWDGEEPLAAGSVRECQSLCEKNPHCLRAYYDGTGRDCYLWTQDRCSVPGLPSRDNSGLLSGRDCGANCTCIDRVCGCGRKLSELWHLASCLKIRDYEEVLGELC